MTDTTYFNVQATGLVVLTLTKPDGQIIKHTVPNKIVTTGLNFIASRMVETSSDVMGYMALGTSATAVVVTDTTLLAPIGTRSIVTTARTNNNITYTANFPSGVGTISSTSIQEAGIFNAVTGGVMMCRTTFPAINKTTDDALSIAWIITISVPA